ncbi:MAG: hypothetical protein GX235_04515 [Clostridiales bacterium]|nr:hypothetical protein [Clostridiales bacterium]
MRKFTALLAMVVLLGYLFPIPGFTCNVLAEENTLEKIAQHGVPSNEEITESAATGMAEATRETEETATEAAQTAGETKETATGEVEEAGGTEEAATGPGESTDEIEEIDEIEEAAEIKDNAEEKINTDKPKETGAEARSALQDILKERTVMALVYLSDEYSIRSEASYDSSEVVAVPSGQQVQIQGVSWDGNYEMWIYVTLYYRDAQYKGYIPRSYLACSDEVFLEWENSYNIKPSVKRSFAAKRSAVQAYMDIEQFPDSYKVALTVLKQAHPNWTFVKMNTNLDWNYVVSEEMKDGRSLIESSFPVYMQDGKYSENWSYASKGILEHYLDPRNGLNESGIFQHELLTYNESYHTQAAVQSFLNNTFMYGNAPNTSLTYANIFWTVGSGLKVSPFHLACRVYQEQGKGTSSLISGTYPGYVGYYNFFNIGATGNTEQTVIESGLARASKEGWTDGYSSIAGGAGIISKNYILKGQDTLYLQKFDVDGSYDGMFWHQYMQNICAPSSEGQNIRKLYSNANSLENTFVFKIPVYNNMPAQACPKPTVSYSISLTPPAGYGDANIYLDGIAYAAVWQDGKYVITAPDGKANTAVMYKYNESNVPIGMYVWRLKHNGTGYEATAVPELEDILSYHGFSIRITGKSGIRFKTGISSSLRSQLISQGAAGYVLKEYGTLVMNNANRAQYPLIKGGEKVLSGMSYGKSPDGVLEDKIYETVSGRHRFTSVLVGLPSNQYKTEYAFRGYIILTKDGTDVTLYGPTVWKSIYSLAKQVLTGGQYEKNSSADLFLNKLIEDADKAGN